MTTRVAVVTGANRGLGYAIVRALLKPGPTKFGGDVILTARSEEKGREAVNKLEDEGKQAKFHQLDVTSQNSINNLKEHLQSKYLRLDVLVNNAGIYKAPEKGYVPTEEDLEIINVNYLSIINTCNALFPLLQEHARVVYLGAGYGSMAVRGCSGIVQKELSSENLTLERLDTLMHQYMRCVKDKTLEQRGFCNFPYGISKAAVHWLARLHQQEFDKTFKDILANVVDPGWVATDMGGQKAPLTPEQGVETAVYLSMLPPNVVQSPRGNYLRKKKVLPWPDLKV